MANKKATSTKTVKKVEKVEKTKKVEEVEKTTNVVKEENIKGNHSKLECMLIKFGIAVGASAIISIISTFIFNKKFDTSFVISTFLILAVYLLISMCILKKSNRNKTFTAILFAVITTVFLTWLLPTTYYQGELVQGLKAETGVFSLVTYLRDAFSLATPTMIYLFAIGGLYGILHNIDSYKVLIKKIANSFKSNEFIFMIATIIIMAVLTSVCGAGYALLIIVPMIISIILEMGYDKITAALVTVGSIGVGLIGTTTSSILVQDMYNGGVTASNYMGVVNTILTTGPKDLILAKIIILILGIALLSASVFMYIRNKIFKNTNLETNDSGKIIFQSNTPIWPIIVVMDLALIIAVISTTSWTTAFNVNFFAEITAKTMEFKLFGFPIFAKIFGSVPAFGEWGPTEFTVLLLFASLIISLIYRVKFGELLNNFFKGAKRALKPAIIVLMIYLILVITYYSSILLTIVKPLMPLKGLNAFLMSLTAFISSTFNTDLVYSASTILGYITETYSDMAKEFKSVAFIWQTMGGFVALVAPTSIVLMSILSYLQISFVDWFKSVWKFLLSLLLIIMVVIIFVVIIL